MFKIEIKLSPAISGLIVCKALYNLNLTSAKFITMEKLKIEMLKIEPNLVMNNDGIKIILDILTERNIIVVKDKLINISESNQLSQLIINVSTISNKLGLRN